ncbi:MAG: Rrf2 family transcriptional regulator [Candidatus Omnitrophica bacterium]|nr:Rrf2 family transcriptional regulator [Candidatus Omnitrophota bacterium]MDD5487682.1 Rrf2 family transcriptional regulator [Candidatus Omnitrophota bacterium]
MTRDTDYAVRALVCIAGSGKKIVSVKELAEELEIPRPFLRKIFQRLNKKGVLKSCKGKGGGFSLVLSPDDINIFDILETFQGTMHLNDHMFKGKVCPHIAECVFKDKLDAIESYLTGEFKAISITSLLKKK